MKRILRAILAVICALHSRETRDGVCGSGKMAGLPWERKNGIAGM